jgi:hypothetical protein
LEIETLFEAQWPNGMVPHIVFGPSDHDYFPNAAFWNVRGVASEPPKRPTSGICQPPVHAIAVKLIADSHEEGSSFVRRMYEPLSAWHSYLHDVRAVDGPLVEIWHPWESGMDNSPAWDAPMEALEFEPDDVPRYRRVDVNLIDPADRPSDAEYDRYAYVAGRLRDEGYTPSERSTVPFRVRDVLFNSALVASERAIAHLAALIGKDPAPHLLAAQELEAAIHETLWDEEAGFYFSRDAVRGEPLRSCIAGGALAFLTEISDRSRRNALLESIDRRLLVEVGDGAVIRTAATDTEGFDPIRYWRGPSWIQMNWMFAYGLEHNGEPERAAHIRRGIVNLVEGAGFHEYFDAPNERGHGTDRFGWTAALYLDLLASGAD